MSLRMIGNPWLDMTPSPVSAAPFSFGGWFNIEAPGTVNPFSDLFSISDNGSSYWDLWHNDSVDLKWEVGDGVTSTDVSMNIDNAGWHYIVVRECAANNRRLSVMRPDGTLQHGQNTVSVTPPTTVRMQVATWVNGSGANARASFSHLWVAVGDIYDAAAQTPDWLLRKLALEGPLNTPSVALKLVGYWTFEKGYVDGVGEMVPGRRGLLKWNFIGNQQPSQGTVEWGIGPEPPRMAWPRKRVENYRLGLV